MIIHDPIYGRFELPPFLEGLVLSPEFRRLSEIRLININSVSLAALADVRRYSHTLGVVFLALQNPLMGFGKEEHRALLAATIVHDAGTPPFAHLFEYFLADRYQWDHESVVSLLVRGEHHPDRSAHQIYSSQIPRFKKLCQEARIDFEIVLAMLEGKHPGSELIFGSVDFDNIDNVARMNWMLGHHFAPARFVELASSIAVGSKRELLIPTAQRSNLQLWADMRRQAYEVLVYDAPTVAGQAVLSAAIADALGDGTLALEDWTYSDADLVRTIHEHSRAGKLRLEKDFFGAPPATLMSLQIKRSDHPLFELSREALTSYIEEYLTERFGVARPYGYVFRDRGTFSKRVEAIDPSSGEKWALGERSNSLVLYGFGGKRARRNPGAIGSEFEDWIMSRIQ